MKKIYFAVILAVLAFSACSNDPDDNRPNSGSKPDNSSSSNTDNSSDSSLDNSSSSNPEESSSSNPDNSSSSDSSLDDSSNSNSDNSSSSNPDNNFSSSSIVTNTPSSSSNSSSSSSSTTSSDSNAESGACYMNILPALNISMCAEGTTEPVTLSDCEEAGEEEGWTVNFQSSCPSEYVLKCEQEGGNIYLYGMMITLLGKTCEDLLEAEEE